MDRSVKVKELHPITSQRMIIISDIHGNLNTFKKLLCRTGYDLNNDHLFLLGDLMEKGPDNLATLRFIMELAQHENVHVLMGNCDFVCKNIVHYYNLEFLKGILIERKESILHEMAAQLQIHIDSNSDMHHICDVLLEHFEQELKWVDALPQVISCGNYIFAHSGIMDEEHYGSDFREVLVYPHFLLKGDSFQRYVIVGHMPVSEYCQGIANFSPIINERKHIISIDGGNIVKKAGQLNAFIIERDKFSYVSADELPIVHAACDVTPENREPLFITWRESEVRILKKDKNRDYCLHLASKRKLWIDHAFLHEQNGIWKADDFTTYQMPLKRGEALSLVQHYGAYAIIKKEGILGWCHARHLCR